MPGIGSPTSIRPGAGWCRGTGRAPRRPRASGANDLRLASPGRLASSWQALAGWWAETPLGWPVAWVVVALTAAALAVGRMAGPSRDLALALLASALCLEASFALLSIASDLRYHLWPMIATALAVLLLLAQGGVTRRIGVVGGIALALVIGAGVVARATLPAPPQSYAGMLG